MQRGNELSFWRKTYFQTSGLVEKAVSDNGLIVNIVPVSSPAWSLRGSSLFLVWATKMLKQIDCQIFLQQRWIYWGLANHYNLASASIVSHGEPHPSLCRARKGELFYRGKEEVEGTRVTEFIAFHQMSACREKRGVFLLPAGLPLLVSWCYLIEVSLSLSFLKQHPYSVYHIVQCLEHRRFSTNSSWVNRYALRGFAAALLPALLRHPAGGRWCGGTPLGMLLGVFHFPIMFSTWHNRGHFSSSA